MPTGGFQSEMGCQLNQVLSGVGGTVPTNASGNHNSGSNRTGSLNCSSRRSTSNRCTKCSNRCTRRSQSCHIGSGRTSPISTGRTSSPKRSTSSRSSSASSSTSPIAIGAIRNSVGGSKSSKGGKKHGQRNSVGSFGDSRSNYSCCRRRKNSDDRSRRSIKGVISNHARLSGTDSDGTFGNSHSQNSGGYDRSDSNNRRNTLRSGGGEQRGNSCISSDSGSKSCHGSSKCRQRSTAHGIPSGNNPCDAGGCTRYNVFTRSSSSTSSNSGRADGIGGGGGSGGLSGSSSRWGYNSGGGRRRSKKSVRRGKQGGTGSSTSGVGSKTRIGGTDSEPDSGGGAKSSRSVRNGGRWSDSGSVFESNAGKRHSGRQLSGHANRRSSKRPAETVGSPRGVDGSTAGILERGPVGGADSAGSSACSGNSSGGSFVGNNNAKCTQPGSVGRFNPGGGRSGDSGGIGGKCGRVERCL
ncbi:uncharacterized transmembrane protein DDB_G0289901-like [Etheostoma spectabile]|uniref:uncharacterized transmembrane protein DDB_G0289901-like n=1 Tax=Etheostoma spectabile TaxID=54343 RepID=UPI0013AF02DE|nr:uncharacterized transmembrane protein DDB_G0289901-like [Etheostoma spectabile]